MLRSKPCDHPPRAGAYAVSTRWKGESTVSLASASQPVHQLTDLADRVNVSHAVWMFTAGKQKQGQRMRTASPITAGQDHIQAVCKEIGERLGQMLRIEAGLPARLQNLLARLSELD